ncbi:hypothetical protein C5C17_03860 [Pseudoclavibacter sp. RFBA6]|nr:hypothetical protein C5C17_03860 [Pseudoclavibacter sp. RFBA6]
MASQPCPVFTEFNQWTRSGATDGQFVQNTGPIQYDTTTDTFLSVADNLSTSTTATVTLSTTFNVVAGRTYTFSWGLRGSLGIAANGSSKQGLMITAAQAGAPTQTVYAGQTRNPDPGFEQILIAGPPPAPRTSSFTATLSGPLTLSYTFTFAPRPVGAETANDDIYAKVPLFATNTC